MERIDLEAKINGPEIVDLNELMLGFLEEFQEEASEETFANVSYWDIIKFFVRYLHKHGYGILQYVRGQNFSKLSPDIEDRCERFYSPDWRERIRKFCNI